MADLGIPRPGHRLFEVDRFGTPLPTKDWYRFWQQIAERALAAGVPLSDFTDLLLYLGSSDGTLAGLPPFNPGGGLPATANVQGLQSVETQGTLAQGGVIVTLLNDVDVPAPTTYYGADGTGNRGWFPIADAFAAQPEITLSVGADGVTTISITPVTDSGAGTLQAITRNSLGQVTGTRPATITGAAGRITVANGDAAAGLPTIDLATVPNTAGGVFRVFDVDSWGRVTARTTRTISGTAGQIAVTNGNGAAGDPTVALVPVANAGGGTLQKTAFDGFGRATGYSTATSDDLAEGVTNRYFTDQRAQDAVGSILVDSPTVNFTYDPIGHTITADTIPQGLFESTGVLAGGALTINAGNNTRFDMSAAVLGFVDYTNPAAPVRTILTVGPLTAQTVPGIGSALATYVGINAAGTVVQQATPFTNTQRRTIAFLGALIHSNMTNLNATNSIVATIRSGISQLHDLMSALGPLNIDGNVFSPNGANLQLDRSAGRIFKFGSNFQASVNDPHVVGLSAATALTFRYRLSTGAEFADRTTIDPLQYESSPGTLSTVPLLLTPVSVQRITIFQTGLCRIQYGQAVYSSIAAAQLALQTDPFTTESNIAENGVFRAFLIVNRGATALNNPAAALFVPISKFGAPASGGAALSTAAIIAALGYTPYDEANYHPQTMSRVSLRF